MILEKYYVCILYICGIFSAQKNISVPSVLCQNVFHYTVKIFVWFIICTILQMFMNKINHLYTYITLFKHFQQKINKALLTHVKKWSGCGVEQRRKSREKHSFKTLLPSIIVYISKKCQWSCRESLIACYIKMTNTMIVNKQGRNKSFRLSVIKSIEKSSVDKQVWLWQV